MRLTRILCCSYFKRYIEREMYEGSLRRTWHPIQGWKEKKKKDWFYNEHRPWTDEFKRTNRPGKRHPKIYLEPIKDWTIFKGDRAGVICDVAKKHYHSYSLHHSQRHLSHTLDIDMSEISEGILLGIGNPLLDITICADRPFLEKYGLEDNNAILADPRHLPMFDEMMRDYEPQYVAGGATQNSIRIAQWLLRKPKATTFFGCVGDDEKGAILRKAGRADGVNVQYQTDSRLPTGVCGAVITGQNRSLVANIGAADFFCHEFLASNWELVEKAQVFYIGGFVFPVCTQSILDVTHHASEKNKIMVMNLSAPFLCKYFADDKLNVMPYVDILFGNETEAETFCKLKNLPATDLKQMALATAALPKVNSKRQRIVVFTHGREPTVVACNGEVKEHVVNPIDPKLIKDTNGCGDSFVGGFLSQLVHGKSLEDCLKCGSIAAKVVIQHWGCTFPKEPPTL